MNQPPTIYTPLRYTDLELMKQELIAANAKIATLEGENVNLGSMLDKLRLSHADECKQFIATNDELIEANEALRTVLNLAEAACSAKDEALEVLTENCGYIYDKEIAECCQCGEIGVTPLSVKHNEGCVQPLVDKALLPDTGKAFVERLKTLELELRALEHRQSYCCLVRQQLSDASDKLIGERDAALAKCRSFEEALIAHAAREWTRQIGLHDMTDEEHDRLAELDIIRGVEANYKGGLDQFKKDTMEALF